MAYDLDPIQKHCYPGTTVLINKLGIRQQTKLDEVEALIVSAKRDPGDEIDVENLMENGWFCDPYDPDYKKGFRMNLSEKPGLDEMFPEHPLSVARALVKYVINNN